jgi:hypothetical protein
MGNLFSPLFLLHWELSWASIFLIMFLVCTFCCCCCCCCFWFVVLAFCWWRKFHLYYSLFFGCIESFHELTCFFAFSFDELWCFLMSVIVSRYCCLGILLKLLFLLLHNAYA